MSFFLLYVDKSAMVGLQIQPARMSATMLYANITDDRAQQT